MDTSKYAYNFTSHFGFPEEWHQRKLPHRNKKGLIQFITYRLYDSLPQAILRQIADDIRHLKKDRKNVEKRKKYQYWLDQGLGSCALSNRKMAQKVMEALKYYDGIRYDLLACSIMPTHVHVLIKFMGDLSKIIQSWKSYTGKWGLANNEQLNLGLDTSAKAFWRPEYWDRFIRNENHFNDTVRYILDNPIKAHLPENHVAYFFTGIRRELLK